MLAPRSPSFPSACGSRPVLILGSIPPQGTFLVLFCSFHSTDSHRGSLDSQEGFQPCLGVWGPCSGRKDSPLPACWASRPVQRLRARLTLFCAWPPPACVPSSGRDLRREPCADARSAGPAGRVTSRAAALLPGKMRELLYGGVPDRREEAFKNFFWTHRERDSDERRESH